MERDKAFDGVVTVTIDGEDKIEFLRHSFYDVLTLLMEQGF